MNRNNSRIFYIAVAVTVAAAVLATMGARTAAVCAIVAAGTLFVLQTLTMSPQKSLIRENDRLSRELEKMSDDLKKTNFFLRERYMKGIIQGEVPPPDRLEPFLDRYNLQFPSNDFIVVSIINEDLSGFFDDEPNCQPNFEAMLSLQWKVIDLFSRELSEFSDFNLVSVDGNLAAILSLKSALPENSYDFEKEGQKITLSVEKCLESAVQGMEKEHHIMFRAAVSEPFHGIYALNKAYMEALSLSEYSFGERKVISIYSAAPENGFDITDSLRRIDLERRFYNFLVSQEFEKAGAVLIERLDEDKEAGRLPLELMKNDLIRRLDFMISIAGISWHTPITNGNELIRGFLDVKESKNYEDLKKRTEKFCDDFQCYWDRVSQNRGGRVGQIVDFIRENYTNPGLNATMICDCFDISQAYLSRTFKQGTGIGVLECIHRIRVEEAKKLLLTDTTINDIAEKVGYYSRRTLSQAFKRCEGVTPDVWRKNQVS